jgi:hypothetical protein
MELKMDLRLALRVAIALTFCWLGSATAEAYPATVIVVDRAGNVYFSDLETIWKFSSEGKLTVFRTGQRGRHVHELAIDADDNIYGADLSYNPATKGWPSALWKMTPNGQITYLVETTENPPRGISIWRDRNGNMYSVDQNNHTKTQTLLLKRTPAGEETTLAGGPYGHANGKGAAARFGSIGGMTFGPKVRQCESHLAENTLVLVSGYGRWRYAISVIAFGILSLAFLIWHRKRRARA